MKRSEDPSSGGGEIQEQWPVRGEAWQVNQTPLRAEAGSFCEWPGLTCRGGAATVTGAGGLRRRGQPTELAPCSQLNEPEMTVTTAQMVCPMVMIEILLPWTIVR